MAILTSEKFTFNKKLSKKDKEEHFIVVKGKIYKDELSILDIYAPNARGPTFIRETLLELKAHIAPHIIIVEDLKNPILAMDKTCKQKLNRDTVK